MWFLSLPKEEKMQNGEINHLIKVSASAAYEMIKMQGSEWKVAAGGQQPLGCPPLLFGHWAGCVSSRCNRVVDRPK